MRTDADYAAQVMQRIEALGQITDEPGRLTRIFASPGMRRANDLVAGWMREAGMSVREDAVGNLIGHYPAAKADAKTFLLGSHLDTVRAAGKFDGPLGVLVAIACVQRLHDANGRLPFAVEVIGFADEEGVRYQSTYLGSRALTGELSETELARVDAEGVTMAEAIRRFGGTPDDLGSARRDPREFLGYAEVHIEQGPVLEKMNLPVGTVSSITGQTRIRATFIGSAAHAGTTPMALRRDALATAATFIAGIENITASIPDLVATVGEVHVEPNASNVIPGRVTLSLDVRHRDDATREAACKTMFGCAHDVTTRRRLQLDWQIVQSIPMAPCSSELTALLKRAARSHVDQSIELPSGAGHDAATLSAITPVAMLFVRCKGGVSHHPDESVQPDDVRVAITVMNEFLRLLASAQR